jgi:Tfp pilus assembly protein PilF
MSERFGRELPDPTSLCEEESIRRYREALAVHPDNPRAMNALADALAAAGRLAEARPLAEQAVAAEPGNGMILDTLGWIQFRQEEFEDAHATLTRARAALPDHPIVLYHLGAACEATGRRDEAEELLRRALAASGEFPGADDARALLDRLR